MPTSNHFHLPAVLEFAKAVAPRRILDAGVGMGTYGYTLRLACDVIPGRLERSAWQTRIEGIEIFPAYRNPIWDYYYDQVHIGDIRSVLPGLGRFDLITCIDVLEHFPREEARAIIRQCLDQATVLIATTPNIDWPQGAVHGNEAETHHCQLDAADFAFLQTSVVTGDTTCFVCTRDEEVGRRLRRARLKLPTIRRAWWVSPALKLRSKWLRWRRGPQP
jgi:hypothetical protein